MGYCTVADLSQYLGISDKADDALLSNSIDRAQAAIEGYTNRKFEADADSTRYFDANEDVEGDILYLDEDLCAITSVTTDADGDADSLTRNTHYITMPRNEAPWYALKMLGSSDYSWTFSDDSEMGIEIAGRWAWSTTAPFNIGQACIRWAAFLYRQKDAQVFETTAVPDMGVLVIPPGIPSDVKLLLDPYRKIV